MTKSALASASCSSVLALLLAAPSVAAVFATQKDALAEAFPDADRIERHSFVLDEEQAEAVRKLSRAPLESRIGSWHVGVRGDAILGYALIDVHVVRTLPEALMVVLETSGRVRSVRILAFHEPSDYLPRQGWFEQFAGRVLDRDLSLHGDVHGIAGATLSARAVTRSVRRALALYQVLLAPAPVEGD